MPSFKVHNSTAILIGNVLITTALLSSISQKNKESNTEIRKYQKAQKHTYKQNISSLAPFAMR
jgi:hypothetical protein